MTHFQVADRNDPEDATQEDAQNAMFAARIRNETTITWQWIARRLTMGHWRTARNAVEKIQVKH